jgi:hypothetical protein
MTVTDDKDFPLVKHGPTDPVEAFRACMMAAVLKYRGDHGINLVRDFAREVDEYLATYNGAGYSRTTLIAIQDIADRCKAKAREDGRVFAYLGV